MFIRFHCRCTAPKRQAGERQPPLWLFSRTKTYAEKFLKPEQIDDVNIAQFVGAGGG
ncbi:MAG TPA: hypothetical protein QF509_02115 [Rhodospirillales bacterium]|jgi:hypothetical protein|nr:hypothetical protein [Rhodospirillaceae bacterium]HJN22700.1 hypothetical protein [Rhodospirillales bacterium]|tara:strand:+ start:58 stop:228 length:171 start_codon:yes stop_codon:yes gene_type:complete